MPQQLVVVIQTKLGLDVKDLLAEVKTIVFVVQVRGERLVEDVIT